MTEHPISLFIPIDRLTRPHPPSDDLSGLVQPLGSQATPSGRSATRKVVVACVYTYLAFASAIEAYVAIWPQPFNTSLCSTIGRLLWTVMIASDVVGLVAVLRSRPEAVHRVISRAIIHIYVSVTLMTVFFTMTAFMGHVLPKDRPHVKYSIFAVLNVYFLSVVSLAGTTATTLRQRIRYVVSFAPFIVARSMFVRALVNMSPWQFVGQILGGFVTQFLIVLGFMPQWSESIRT